MPNIMTDDLAFSAARVAIAAAIAAAKLVGRGDEKAADQAAVDAMRTALNAMAMKGRIVIGERPLGGAPAREGFTVHPHLEATGSVAEAVNPKTSGNWEGTGVTPDLQTPAAQARDTAYRRALQDVTVAGGASAAEAQTALAAQADAG